MVRDAAGLHNRYIATSGPRLNISSLENCQRCISSAYTVYVLKKNKSTSSATGWGFSAFNEFMNKALATFAFVCIGGVALTYHADHSDLQLSRVCETSSIRFRRPAKA